jgi:hypothetical protein
MRTWLHQLPRRPHAGAASFSRCPGQPSHDKKRVPVPVISGAPYALAKETGCPEGITARRTEGALD